MNWTPDHIIQHIQENEVNLFMALFCLGMSVNLLIDLSKHFRTYDLDKRTQIFLGKKRIPFISRKRFVILAILLILSLVVAGIGVVPREYLLIPFLLYFPVYGQLNSLARKTNLYPFILFFLAVVPNVPETTISANTAWPLLFVKTKIAWVYFSSFIQKLLQSPQSWLNGSKLTQVLDYHDQLNGTQVSGLLSNFSWMVVLVSFAVLIFEAVFWSSIFLPQFDLYYGLAAILFHLLILWGLKINYLRYYLPALVLFFV